MIRAACITSLALCAVMNGATRTAQGQELPPLQRVDPVVEDMNALSTSQRRLEPGLAQPTGFEFVYRVPGHDDYFMRVDGGLFAVFPQSVYVRTRGGTFPLVPANTTFYIGTPALFSAMPWRAVSTPGPTPSLGLREAMRIDVNEEHRLEGASRRPSTGDGLVPHTSGTDPIRAARHAAAQARATGTTVPKRKPPPLSRSLGLARSPLPDDNRAILGPAIVRDPAYRAARLRTLMQRATHAATTRDAADA